MDPYTDRITIVEIPSGNLIPRPDVDDAGVRPSLQHFLNQNTILLDRHTMPVLQTVYATMYRLLYNNPMPQETVNSLTKKISAALLKEGLWTWHIHDLAIEILHYFEQYPGTTPGMREVTGALKERLPLLFKKHETDPGQYIEPLVREIIRAFQQAGESTSIREISNLISSREELSRLPDELITGVVREFFELLFTKGLITYNRD